MLPRGQGRPPCATAHGGTAQRIEPFPTFIATFPRSRRGRNDGTFFVPTGPVPCRPCPQSAPRPRSLPAPASWHGARNASASRRMPRPRLAPPASRLAPSAAWQQALDRADRPGDNGRIGMARGRAAWTAKTSARPHPRRRLLAAGAHQPGPSRQSARLAVPGLGASRPPPNTRGRSCTRGRPARPLFPPLLHLVLPSLHFCILLTRLLKTLLVGLG
jgi:hypothetical protein